MRAAHMLVSWIGRYICWGGLSLILFLTMIVDRACGQTASADGPCAYEAWHESRTLDPGRDAGLGAKLQLISGADRLYFAANTVGIPPALGLSHSDLPQAIERPFLYQHATALWTGAVSKLDASSVSLIAPPPGDFTFKHPVGTVDPDGTLHLIWAEPNPDSLAGYRADPPPHSPMFMYTQLYHAYYGQKGWSEPKRIYQGDPPGLYWSGNSPSFKAGTDGQLHLAVTQKGVSGGGLLYLNFSPEEGWNTHRIGYRSSKTALAVGPEGSRIAIAYVGLETNENLDSREVQVATSGDGGASWQRTTVLPPDQRVENERGNGTVREVQVMGQPGDTLHVMWGRNLSRSTFSAQELWHARSTDGGQRWRARRAVRFPKGGGFFWALHLAEDRCGGLHAVARVEPADTDQVFYTWNRPGETWKDLRALSDTTAEEITGSVLEIWRGRLWLVTVEPPTTVRDSTTVRYRTRPIRRSGRAP
jgi:hypothetical protein